MNNLSVLVGRIGKDAEVKEFEDGRVAINFSIATTDTYQNANGEKVDSTIWHNCTLYRKSASQGISKHLTKGKLVSVSGTLQYYDRDIDDKTVKVAFIRIDDITFLG